MSTLYNFEQFNELIQLTKTRPKAFCRKVVQRMTTSMSSPSQGGSRSVVPPVDRLPVEKRKYSIYRQSGAWKDASGDIFNF